MNHLFTKRFSLFFLAILCSASLYSQVTPAAPYSINLVVPPVLTGVGPNNDYYLRAHDSSYTISDGTDTFRVNTMSYNNLPILGPTIIWNTGDSVRMHLHNETGMTSTCHWHGAHVPAWCDGGPHDSIMMDSTWNPYFKVMDPPSTMWYHPHLHMHTESQVQMGMAGMIIINDPADPFYASLPHTYNVDDFPLVLQDKNLLALSPGTGYIDTCCSMGPTTVVNGVHAPVLTVPAQRVRFRILNGASERAFNLSFSDSTTYYVIATDAGYTAAPVQMDTGHVLMGGGERIEWEVDFTGRQGDTLYLTSYMEELINETDIPGTPQGNPGCYLATHIDSFNYNLMRIVVGPQVGTPAPPLPASFAPLVLPDTIASPANHRTKKLLFYNPTEVNMCGDTVPPFIIDNKNFVLDSINDIILLNANEIWTIRNTSGEAHPFHIHDISFYILDVADTNGTNRQPPPAYMQGPKDVVFVRNGTEVRFLTQFTDFYTTVDSDSAYMYHCHILAHEDGGMMHQFVVTDSVGFFTGLNVPDPAGQWSVYPNPTDEKFILNGECNRQSTVRIYNMLGEVVSEAQLAPFNGEKQLDVATLPAGIYYVEWIRPDGSDGKKLIVR